MLGYTEEEVDFMIDSIVKVHNSLPANNSLDKEELMAKNGLRVAKEFLEGVIAEGHV